MVMDELTGRPLPIVDKESLETGVGWAPAPFVPAPFAEVQASAPAPSSSLAASVSGLNEDATKKEKAETASQAPALASIITPHGLQPRDDAWFLDIEGREYRAGGWKRHWEPTP